MNTQQGIIEFDGKLQTSQPFELPQLAEQIKAVTKSAETSARTAMNCALEAGALLIEAKKLVQHGEWESWLTNNCEVAPRTAQAYMRLAKSVPLLEESKAQRVADLPVREAIRAIATDPTKPSQPRRANIFLAKKDDANRAIAALNKSAAALKAGARSVFAARGIKGAQIVSLRKNLTDALAAIDRMEADSAKAEQNGGAV